MSEAAKMRMERIERLMRELEYEIVRGVMEREIAPDIHLAKIFPYEKHYAKLVINVTPESVISGVPIQNRPPRLRVIKNSHPRPRLIGDPGQEA